MLGAEGENTDYGYSGMLMDLNLVWFWLSPPQVCSDRIRNLGPKSVKNSLAVHVGTYEVTSGEIENWKSIVGSNGNCRKYLDTFAHRNLNITAELAACTRDFHHLPRRFSISSYFSFFFL